MEQVSRVEMNRANKQSGDGQSHTKVEQVHGRADAQDRVICSKVQ